MEFHYLFVFVVDTSHHLPDTWGMVFISPDTSHHLPQTSVMWSSSHLIPVTTCHKLLWGCLHLTWYQSPLATNLWCGLHLTWPLATNLFHLINHTINFLRLCLQLANHKIKALIKYDFHITTLNITWYTHLYLPV